MACRAHNHTWPCSICTRIHCRCGPKLGRKGIPAIKCAHCSERTLEIMLDKTAGPGNAETAPPDLQTAVDVARQYYNQLSKKKSHLCAKEYARAHGWTETGDGLVDFLYDPKVTDWINHWVHNQ